MTTMTFIRHGNTDWNNEKRYQGHAHNTLSDRGRQQAERVAHRLAKEPWDLLISSDLMRARQTAEIISAHIGRPVDFYDQRLREIGRGKLEGLIGSEIEEKFGVDWREQDLGEETVDSVRERGVRFITDMAERYPAQKLLVVSHGLLIRESLQKLMQQQEEAEGLDNGSVTTIKLTDHGWQYELYNCTKHDAQELES